MKWLKVVHNGYSILGLRSRRPNRPSTSILMVTLVFLVEHKLNTDISIQPTNRIPNNTFSFLSPFFSPNFVLFVSAFIHSAFNWNCAPIRILYILCSTITFTSMCLQFLYFRIIYGLALKLNRNAFRMHRRCLPREKVKLASVRVSCLCIVWAQLVRVSCARHSQ